MNEQQSASVIERLAVLQESIIGLRAQMAQIAVSGEKRDTELRTIEKELIGVKGRVDNFSAELAELKDNAKWLRRTSAGQLIAAAAAALVYAVTHWPR